MFVINITFWLNIKERYNLIKPLFLCIAYDQIYIIYLKSFAKFQESSLFWKIMRSYSIVVEGSEVAKSLSSLKFLFLLHTPQLWLSRVKNQQLWNIGSACSEFTEKQNFNINQISQAVKRVLLKNVLWDIYHSNMTSAHKYSLWNLNWISNRMQSLF